LPLFKLVTKIGNMLLKQLEFRPITQLGFKAIVCCNLDAQVFGLIGLVILNLFDDKQPEAIE
jgi:hypothetical protein